MHLNCPQQQLFGIKMFLGLWNLCFNQWISVYTCILPNQTNANYLWLWKLPVVHLITTNCDVIIEHMQNVIVSSSSSLNSVSDRVPEHVPKIKTDQDTLILKIWKTDRYCYYFLFINGAREVAAKCTKVLKVSKSLKIWAMPIWAMPRMVNSSIYNKLPVH